MITTPEPAAGCAEIPVSWTSRCVADAFADVVAEDRHRTALRWQGESVSFGALAARVEDLAGALLAVAPGRRRPVVLLLDDPVEQVAGMLAVLRAGNFFVPLAVTDPPARLRECVDRCQAPAIVAGDAGMEIAERIAPELPRLHVSDTAPGPGAAPPDAVSPADPAYLVFTSGSTGSPKGVMHSHRNLLHHVAKFARLVQLTPDDRVVWLTSYSHAAAISDVFPTVLSGATLVPFQPWKEGLAGLGRRLEEEHVSVYHSAPTLLRKLLETDLAGKRFANVRLARLAGEPVLGRDVRACRALFGDRCRVLTTLSTTELNLARAMDVGPDPGPDEARMPVGFPVEETEVLILDEQGAVVPAGVAGRIAIRSRYLSTGYWHQPELTAEAFVADAADPALRTYMSGDLGKLDPDGCLVHLGRLSDRVKVHGQGVDLREVEQAIISLEAAREVAVVDIPDPSNSGDVVLVAWLGGAASGSQGTVELRRRLADRLPTYMIPAHFQYAETLPASPQGKVDRHALRARGIPAPAGPGPSRSPATDDRVRELTELWESMLQSGPVGPTDDFFDLGGDSLLAMTMLWEVKRRFDMAVSPVEFTHDPTVRGLVQALTGADCTATSDVLLPLRATGHLSPLFFVAGGGGGAEHFAFVYDRLLRALPEERPVYGLITPPPDDPEDVLELNQLSERYAAAIRNTQPTGPYYVAGECLGCLVAFEVACRLEREGGTVARLVLLDPPPAAPATERALGARRLRKWLGRRRRRLNLVSSRARHHLRTLRQVPLIRWPDYLRRLRDSAGQLRAMERQADVESSHRLSYQQAALRFRAGDRLRGDLNIIYSESGGVGQYESSWRALAAGKLAVHVVEGDHKSYIRRRFVRSTAACLAGCLED